MQLHKLELIGFKSFAEKTEFIFEPGVTAFVGPNGCGKSNVVDAVKWVLGEQSAKSLRGKEMVDMIYNGSNGHPQRGYAEASLTILNKDRTLPIDYEEVCITRRIYRSGESEYLLNKQACRLRDIRELFMDTGVGCDVYSVIEQGQVDLLLQANAQERRAIFEEAAGIAKYKAKKREALARLERVNQNLLRVGDLIEEVERELRSVRLQAQKAKRYQRYAGRLAELKVMLALKQYLDLGAKKDDAEGRVRILTDAQQQLNAAVAGLEAEQSRVEVATVRNEKLLTGLRAEAASMEARRAGAQEKIANDKRRIAELSQSEQGHRGAAESIRQRAERAREESVALAEKRSQSEEEIRRMRDRIEERTNRVTEMDQECKQLSESIEMRKIEVVGLLQKRSKLHNEMTAIEAENRSFKARAARLEERQNTLEAEISSLRTRQDELASARDAIAAEIAARVEDCRAREAELAGVQERMTRLRQDREAHRLERAECLSRKKVLEDLEARAEGVNAGVKYVLEAARREDGLSGVKGMVADMIEVDFEHALAIEAALDEGAQHVVTESTSHAVRAMEALRRDDAGRAWFLPMDRLTQKPSPVPESLLNEPGVIGRAADLVRVKNGGGAVVEHLLGDTIVVDKIERAIALGSNGAADLRLVTLQGDIVEPHGPICGGGRLTGSIISRKSELTKLEEDLARIGRELSDIESELQRSEERAKTLDEELRNLRSDIESKNMARLEKDNDIKACEERLQGLLQESGVNEQDLVEVRCAIEQNVRNESELQQQLEQLDRERQEMESRVKEDSARLNEKAALRDSAAAELTELRVTAAQKEEKLQALKAAIENLAREISEREEQAASRESEAARCRRLIAEAEEEIKRNEAMLAELAAKTAETNERIQAAATERERLAERHTRIQDELRSHRQRLNSVGEELQNARLEAAQHEVKMSDLVEKTKEEFQVDLREKQPAPDFDQVNWAEVEAEIDDLRGKIARMGNVNLDAIEEQREKEERAAFLKAQKEDIENSQKSLQDSIRRINRQSRIMFRETFEAIRENFRETFRKLFEGGRADLVLEPDVDILEAGIDIIACPPGKTPRSIMLLSGGEKTLTTVALLFAIFKAKPSPFCILDEIDAALDESNIDRFVSLLQEYLGKSQFVIITHNKRTMGVADVLYGITMQRSGVSKKVSVKFEKREPEAAAAD